MHSRKLTLALGLIASTILPASHGAPISESSSGHMLVADLLRRDSIPVEYPGLSA